MRIHRNPPLHGQWNRTWGDPFYVTVGQSFCLSVLRNRLFLFFLSSEQNKENQTDNCCNCDNAAPEQCCMCIPQNEDVLGDCDGRAEGIRRLIGLAVIRIQHITCLVCDNQTDMLSAGGFIDSKFTVIASDVIEFGNRILFFLSDINLNLTQTDCITCGICNILLIAVNNCIFQTNDTVKCRCRGIHIEAQRMCAVRFGIASLTVFFQ